mmetsp:Transcript_58668/g.105016  ORF Transcript_58668/g.105016 Transcript_58668/m.105016 type:complete len:115 (+) Transcript_58668:102-446(+)
MSSTFRVTCTGIGVSIRSGIATGMGTTALRRQRRLKRQRRRRRRRCRPSALAGDGHDFESQVMAVRGGGVMMGDSFLSKTQDVGNGFAILTAIACGGGTATMKNTFLSREQDED